MAACNFSIDATEEDGSCDYCSCEQDSFEGYGLLVESHVVHEEGELAGLTTYRMCDDAQSHRCIQCDVGGFRHAFAHHHQHLVLPASARELFGTQHFALAFEVMPELEYDSWLTVGLDGPAGPNDQAPSPLEILIQGG